MFSELRTMVPLNMCTNIKAIIIRINKDNVFINLSYFIMIETQLLIHITNDVSIRIVEQGDCGQHCFITRTNQIIETFFFKVPLLLPREINFSISSADVALSVLSLIFSFNLVTVSINLLLRIG